VTCDWQNFDQFVRVELPAVVLQGKREYSMQAVQAVRMAMQRMFGE
jgi:hypothetical protein